MTVHYALPTTADFATLAGAHAPAISVYASTSPVVSERERAEVAVKSAFDRGVDEIKSNGADAATIDALRTERDRVLADRDLWAGLSRSLAIFVSPDVSEVFVLPNRLDDAVHVGSHFTLGQLLRAPSQDQEAVAITLSSHEWGLWHATPTERAVQLEVDPSHPKNADEATNREPNENSPRGGMHGDRGATGDERRKALVEQYAKRLVDASRTELAAVDPDHKLPLFVFAAEPLLGLFVDRARNGRRVVGVHGAPDRLGAADVDKAIRSELAALNVREADEAVSALADGSAGRVERDLAAIAREAADGAVETYWFDFTRSINGVLDHDSGAVRFAGTNGEADELDDGTPAGDLLSQVALLVQAKGGAIVTVRGDDMSDTWHGPAMAQLRYALA